MLHLKYALRRIKKNKTNAAIQLLGFTISFVIISLVARIIISEFNTDKIHTNKNRIYSVMISHNNLWTPVILNDLLRESEYIERVVPYAFGWDKTFFKYENNLPLESNSVFVDSNFFNAFSFDFILGSPINCLAEPFTAVLTQSEAKRLFGNENPIGKIIKYNAKNNITIQGVIKDYPKNSIFTSQSFISFKSLKTLEPFTFSCKWSCNNINAFVMLKNANNYVQAQSFLINILNEHNKDDDNSTARLIQLEKLFFNSHIDRPEKMNSGNKTKLYVFIVLGILIFVIAIFNYFNLSLTAILERKKDTGTLKVFGCKPRQLFLIFFTNALVLTVISWVLALLLLKVFSLFIVNKISLFNYTEPSYMASIIPFIILLVLSVVGGVLSTIFVHKKSILSLYKSKTSKSKSNWRFALLMFQFCIVVILIGASIVITKQVQFMHGTNPGYNKENIICLDISSMTDEKHVALKSDLLSIAGVLNVAYSDAIPGKSMQGWVCDINVNGQEKEIRFASIPAEPDFLKVYNFRLAQGRYFNDSLAFPKGEIILNKTACKQIGWKDPIGKNLLKGWFGKETKSKVVGIIEDHHFESMHKAIRPLIIVCLDGYADYISIKAAPGYKNQKNIIATAEKLWNKLEPDIPFSYFYFNQSIDNLYKSDVELSRILLFLAFISILITILGLMGVILYTMQIRTKEIGIRKVNGAKISELMQMLNSDFVKWVVLAIVIATPFTFYAMQKWLKNFAYKTPLNWWVFALAACIVMCIVLLTVSYLTYKAARRNPVEALRYE